MSRFALLLTLSLVLVGLSAVPAEASAPQDARSCPGMAQALARSPKLDLSSLRSGTELLIVESDEIARPLLHYAGRCAEPPGDDGFVRLDGRALGLAPPKPSPDGERLIIRICVETKKLSVWIEIHW